MAHADTGFVLSLAAQDQLTWGQGKLLGRVDVKYEVGVRVWVVGLKLVLEILE